MYKAIIVDDDPMVADIDRQYLEAHGGITIAGVFGNGRAALEYVRAYPTDLAIVDYYMPVANGREFVRICCDEGLHLDVIMITANNDAKEVAALMRMGVIDYLVKPFTRDRFSQAIQRFLARRAVLHSGEGLSQKEIDSLLSGAPPVETTQKLLDKGLQQKTLELIFDFLEKHKSEYLSNEEISKEVGLSKITVRRYMNYLLEAGEITSEIDYATGGRPSMRYRKRQ